MRFKENLTLDCSIHQSKLFKACLRCWSKITRLVVTNRLAFLYANVLESLNVHIAVMAGPGRLGIKIAATSIQSMALVSAGMGRIPFAAIFADTRLDNSL